MGGSQRQLRVCFTGHRPDRLGGYEDNKTQRRTRETLRRHIQELVDKYDFVEFTSGVALGVDTWAAIEVIRARLANPGKVELRLAIPFVGQQNKWPLPSQQEWLSVYRAADTIYYVDEEGYAPWKLLNRNKWMVDNSDLVIAVWSGDPKGGTAHCIRYASKQGQEILNLWREIHNEQ